jgi:hypothetical protein
MKPPVPALLLAALLASTPAAGAGTPAPGEGHQVAAAQRGNERRLAAEQEGALAPRARPADETPSQAKREPAVRSDDGATEAKASPPATASNREDHGGDDR